jgi:hypothetical protein
MKQLVTVLVVLLLWSACSPKKSETATTPVDSTAIDSVLATTPAPALLAFSSIDGFTAAKGAATPDSVNYFLLNDSEDLVKSFAASGNVEQPDFIINYIIGVICQATNRPTTLSLDKVVTSENTLDVYLSLTRGAAGGPTSKPAQLFAIEKREGYPVMQFYINGKKDKALVLVGNP